MREPTETTRRFSGLALNLRPPPAHADKQETPVVKELRLFVFEGVADELQCPSRQKKDKRVKPQPVNENAEKEQAERNQNGRNPQGMANPVHRMLMAAGILRNPLFVSAAAKHGDLMIYGLNGKVTGPVVSEECVGRSNRRSPMKHQIVRGLEEATI